MEPGDAAFDSRIAHFLGFVQEKQPASEFISAFRSLFPYIHQRELTASYRLARKPVKKIADESAILAHFLQQCNSFQFTRQNLGNGIPDAWLWTENACIDVEITVALATMRRAIAERLNEVGSSSGFVPLDDQSDIRLFRNALDSDKTSYTSESYLGILSSGVLRRVAAKLSSDRRGLLLIGCPIGEEYASAELIDRLAEKIAPDLPPNGFDQVYLVDRDRAVSLKPHR